MGKIFVAITLMAAQPAPAYWHVWGVGHNSCAKAFSSYEQFATFAWIMGFFTGRDDGKRQTGRSTDGDGIVGEVKKLCADEPSTPLIAATIRVYDRMRQQGR